MTNVFGTSMGGSPVVVPPPLPGRAGVAGRRPGDGRGLLRLIIDHNPCFILSALSMMFGCYLLNDATGDEAGNMGKTLLVLAALNVYEFAVIGLAMVLMRRRPGLRDSRILLGLEALFFVDLAFLNANVVMTNLWWGVVINLLMLALAWVKLGLIMRTLGRGVGWGQLGFMGLQLAMLYVLPISFRVLGANGSVSAVSVYGMWWAVGMLPVAYDLLQRFWGRQMGMGEGYVGVKRLYLALPWLSLIAHLGFFHWVYLTPFHMADLAPVFLGLAVLVGRLPAIKWVEDNLVVLRGVLPAVAILVSMGGSGDLTVQLFGHGQLEPFVLVMLAAAVAYIYMFLFKWTLWCVAAGMVGLLMYMFGPTARQSGAFVQGGFERADGLVMALLPRTAVSWGIIAVVGSFVLLGAGAFFSLRRGHVPEKVVPEEAASHEA